MYPAGFEPAHPEITELESVALDHSAKGTNKIPGGARTHNLPLPIPPMGLEGGRLSHLATGTKIIKCRHKKLIGARVLYQLSYRTEVLVGLEPTTPPLKKQANCWKFPNSLSTLFTIPNFLNQFFFLVSNFIYLFN